MLWTLVAVLLVLWLVGWGLQIAGSLIHLLLLLAALLVLLASLLRGRSAT